MRRHLRACLQLLLEYRQLSLKFEPWPLHRRLWLTTALQLMVLVAVEVEAPAAVHLQNELKTAPQPAMEKRREVDDVVLAVGHTRLVGENSTMRHTLQTPRNLTAGCA